MDEERVKRCSTCTQTKSVAEFGLRARNPDGLRETCKECRRKPNSPMRLKRACGKALLASGFWECRRCDRVLPLSEYRRGKRAPYECNDCHNAAQKARSQRADVRERKRLQSIAYAASPANAPKIAARYALNLEIKRGNIKRQPCASCGKSNADAHHHNGYDEAHWFDVEWLCRKCHMRLHHSERLSRAS